MKIVDKKTVILLVTLMVIFNNCTVTYSAQDTEIFTAEPVLFVPIQEKAGFRDFTFPNLNPIGVKEDSSGNIHSWMYYIQDDLVHVYYTAVLTNGTTQFFEVDTHPAVEIFSFLMSPTLGLFFRENLVETADGSIMAVFLKTSDFGTSLMKLTWKDGIFRVDKVAVPKNVEFKGSVIGPVENNGYIEYYFPGTNTTDDSKSLFEIQFVNTTMVAFTGIKYPTVTPVGSSSKALSGVFDIGYANNSRYWLAAVRDSLFDGTLSVIQEDENGTFTVFSQYKDLNAGPSLIPVADFMLAEMMKPVLAITESGQLFSFIFGMQSDNQVRELLQWKNQTTVKLFKDMEQDPFEFAILPVIDTYKDDVRISSMGFDFTQSVFTLSADVFTFNSENMTLTRQKYQDFSFSSTFFLFVMDLKSPTMIGLVTTVSTPDFLLNEYRILNGSVAAAFIIADHLIPNVTPVIKDLVVEGEKTADSSNIVLFILMIPVFFTGIVVTAVGIFYWRWRILQFPPAISEIDLKKEVHVFARFTRTIQRSHTILWIFTKTNSRRFLNSIVVLFLPSLILMSLFVGLSSHQDHLIYSYENQNPLNDKQDLALQPGDFTWYRTMYDDELANKTISVDEWKLPRSLSQSYAIRYGCQEITEAISSITFFQLSEKRIATNPQNESQSYPFSHSIAIIEDDWLEYIESQLIEGRLPLRTGEVLLQQDWNVRPDPYNPAAVSTNWGLNSTIELYGRELDIYLNTTMPDLSQNITVVGIVRKVENLPFSTIKYWTERLNTTVSGLRSLDSVPFYMNTENASSFLTSYIRLNIIPVTHVSVRYNVFDLPRESMPAIIDKLNNLANTTLQETGFLWLGTFDDERIVSFLQGFYDSSRDLQLEGALLTMPVLILIVFLTYGALGITKSSTQEEIVRFRKEGLRTELMIVLFGFERIMTAAIAVISSILLLPFVTALFLSFVNFFEIDSNSSPPLSLNILWITALAVFVLLSIVGIYLSAKWLLEDHDWKYSRIMHGVKGDMIIIVTGLVLVIGANFFITFFQDQVSNTDNGIIDPGTELVIVTLELFAILVTTFGTMLVFSKILNRVFIGLGIIGWRLFKNPFGLIFKSIYTHISIYSNSLLVFIICFFLIIPMLILPPTISYNYQLEAYDDLGADIKVENWSSLSNETQQQVRELEHVEQVSTFFFGSVKFANTPRINIFGFDPSTFLDTTAKHESLDNYTGFNLNTLITLDSGTAMTNEDFMERNALVPGDTITLEFPHIEDVYNITLAGSYKEFPVLKHEIASLKDSDDPPLQMVITLTAVKELERLFTKNGTDNTLQTAETLQQRSAIIKADDIENVNKLKEEIKDLCGARMETVTQLINELYHPFFRTFEFIIHVSVILASLTPVLTIYILSSVLFERRKFELEVYRRSGMKRRFFIGQMTAELFITVLIPGLAGILIGLAWSTTSGPEFFGEETKNLFWVYNVPGIVLWTLLIQLSAIVLWTVKINNSARLHLKEVRS
ncbi:MAG: FtsX-like permease family protein [Candidatus Hodarchaeales archaeon]